MRTSLNPVPNAQMCVFEGNAVAAADLEDVLYYIKEIQAAFFFFRSKFVPWRFGR
jgi:hypothetical protein